MLSIATIALAIGLMFVYRGFHPAFHPSEAGQKLAKRIRVGLLGVIVALSVTVGYLFPVEVGRGIQRMERHQSQLQSDRTERRMIAERRHTAQMIEIFGGADRYLAFLDAQNRKKNPF